MSNHKDMKFTRFWNWRFPVAGSIAAVALIIGAGMFLPSHGKNTAVVARNFICAGCEITARDLRKSSVDGGVLPKNYYTDAPVVVGKKAAVALEPGTVMQPGMLVENAFNDLKPGEVAFALSVDDSAVAGFSKTGQVVEIWASNVNMGSQLLATGVRVLGIETAKDSLLGTGGAKNTAYLAAPEESARKVVGAKSTCDLSFVLRG